MESSPDYTLAPGSSGKLPRSRCGLRHSFDYTTDGRRTGEGLEWSQAGRRLAALLSLCSKQCSRWKAICILEGNHCLLVAPRDLRG